MKYFLNIALIILLPVWMNAQQSYPDSLREALKIATTDSAKYFETFNLFFYYQNGNVDSAFFYADKALLIARRNNYKINEADCLANKGSALANLGKYVESFECFTEAFKIAEDPANETRAWKFDDKYSNHQVRLAVLGYARFNFAVNSGYAVSTAQKIPRYNQALKFALEVADTTLIGLANCGLGDAYKSLNKKDSALRFFKSAEQVLIRRDDQEPLAAVHLSEGEIYLAKGDKNKALDHYHKASQVLIGSNTKNLGDAYWHLANFFLQEHQKDSSLYYAKKSIEILYSVRAQYIGRAYLTLAKSYELRKETDSAYKYQGLALTGMDSTYHAEIKNQSEFQKQSFKDQMRVKELEQEKASYQNRIRTNILLGGLFTVLVISFFLFRNNRQKQKANSVIAHQKEKVESTLAELKSTQAQLIQSEKMASLGELTAGIAHEIQNPLNFVNNFSEVNKEMIGELQGERSKVKGERNEEIEDEIINDIKENEEKINHHGKRADAIVKGMMQHSRTSTGHKEPTDINALCDEYLRLSYHGLRAKDKDFNADFKTNFDESIGKIQVIPQDIGRVLLNLFNNAFYAVNEKKKQSGESYQPTVLVTTKSSGSNVEIIVKDSGTGIPQKIVDKIFQPFFTTKPTGQGTGLGLSLSYDIVKAYGGEIKVETKEGEGAEFIVELLNASI